MINTFVMAILAVLTISCSHHQDTLVLSPLFSDGMILQQSENVAIWGESEPNEKVIISGSWGAQSQTNADKTGAWLTYLETPAAGGPFEVKVSSGGESLTINDVLIGEVWLAAGQSNMEMDFNYCRNTTDNAEMETSTADYPEIRMFTVKKQSRRFPTKNLSGSWEKAVGTNITYFSAAGYYFAKKLHKELKVPVGIIHASWGGSNIETWISRETISSFDFLEQSLEYYDSLAAASANSEAWFSQFESVPLPGIGWEFYLGTETARRAPEIDYIGFFIEQWRTIDFKDEEIITKLDNYENWNKIILPSSLKNIFGTNNFSGVTLLKRTFELDTVSGDYLLQINRGEDMGWDLFEVDCYLNGKRIGSTLGEPGEDIKQVYQTFPERHLPTLKIQQSNLKAGINEIALRVIGAGEINNITLTSQGDADISLTGEWHYHVSAEIYDQFDKYVFPYSSFYLYNRADINFSARPSSFATYNRYGAYSSLFNGMIYPLIPYAIKGVIWYQGENNVFRADQYATLFPALVADWRARWGNEFSFYYAQIAPYFTYAGHSASFRDVQRKCLDVIPKSGMVVTMDIGEIYDIHPSNKHDVGNRFAGLALSNDYGKLLVASGPLYRSMVKAGNTLVLDFDHKGSGLVAAGSGLSEFEISGGDRKYVSATARIVDNKVVVSSSQVADPEYARYAWSDTSNATLFNKEGLPASSFSTEPEKR